MAEKKIKVRLVQFTPGAERLLALAKNTRLLGSDSWEEVFNRPTEEVMKDVEYSMSTIRGPLEFIHYVFLIENASRAMTHQLVRHRVVSFAQQSLRVSKSLDFYLPEGIEVNEVNSNMFRDTVAAAQHSYKKMIEQGADIQDARGVLPIATTSAIMMKANLRAMLDLLEVRLCLRVQGEFQEAAYQMAEFIRVAHPWTRKHIGPHCLVKGTCLFPRFDQCPISKAVPELRGLPEEKKETVAKIWVHNIGRGIQPKIKKEEKSGQSQDGESQDSSG